jgi:nucleoside-diphosphate-sugar epimerase
VSFGYNPHEVITPSVQDAVNALKAAYAEPSVKRFVQCSSSSAAVQGIPIGASPITTTKDSYNEAAVALAWKEPYSPERGGDVYAASKTQQEQAIWKYHKEHQAERPDLIVNTGEYMAEEHQAKN